MSSAHGALPADTPEAPDAAAPAERAASARSDAVTVIRPNTSWLRLDLGIFWRFRDLLWLFVRRDVTVRYRQTILGPLWLIIQPLAMTGVLTVMIKGVAGMSTDGAPAALFYMSGLIMWGYFSQTVLAITQVFIQNEHLFSKVYFPRLLVPTSTALSNCIGAGIQVALLLVVVAALSVAGVIAPPLLTLLALPAAMLQVVAFALGVGLITASCTAKYRDLGNAAPFLVQSGLFLTPIVYPFSAVPPQFRLLASLLNPLAPMADVWRFSVLGTLTAGPAEIAASALTTLLVLGVGLILFQRVERTVADVI